MMVIGIKMNPASVRAVAPVRRFALAESLGRTVLRRDWVSVELISGITVVLATI